MKKRSGLIKNLTKFAKDTIHTLSDLGGELIDEITKTSKKGDKIKISKKSVSVDHEGKGFTIGSMSKKDKARMDKHIKSGKKISIDWDD